MPERPTCPLCGRPVSENYSVEEDACQFFRHMRERLQTGDIIVYECIKRAIPRIRALEARLVDLEASNKTAQRALARHHAAQNPAEFPDDARIE